MSLLFGSGLVGLRWVVRRRRQRSLPSTGLVYESCPHA